MLKTGLIAGSYKPFHAGHFKVIEIAAQENDIVFVFVSLKTRARELEMPVYEEDMRQIWENYIDPYLPPNVEVRYVSVPIREVWQTLGAAEENKTDQGHYTIYGDTADIASRFSESQLMKYVPNIYSNGQVTTKPLDRASTIDVSGTKIRNAVANRNKDVFMVGMPSEIDREAIWDILVQRADERTPEKKKRVSRKKKNEAILYEAVEAFEKWLSPEVVNLLVSNYALPSTFGEEGKLKWAYSNSLGYRTWGMYVPTELVLYVNKSKTTDKFKQQVNTILHEIQHYNQHSRYMENSIESSIIQFIRYYKGNLARQGYENSEHEIDARQFADDHIQEAMNLISNHYKGTVVGMTVDDVIEEFFEEFAETRKPITKREIGEILKDYGLNNAKNIKYVLQQLKELDVKIAI